MFKNYIHLFSILILVLLFGSLKSSAEEIHFDNDVYTLKHSEFSTLTEGFTNEYYRQNEDPSHWIKMIGLYHYTNESSPLKFAKSFDKTISETENSTLVKFIENKKQDKALISFLVNKSENYQNYFEYNVYKYEKHPKKGVLLLKYSIKYFFTTEDQITQIGKQVSERNDKYMELFITSPMPKLIEKDISQ